MAQQRTALVLGASGGIGGEVATGLLRRGWAVRGLHRAATPPAAPWLAGMAWHRGDAMRPEDVAQAAGGAALLVHAVNPPGYRRWNTLVLPMLDNSIAAAGAAGARILLPGTVYNYGPDAFPLLTEAAPQHPLTRKGAIRVAMEQRLQAAAARGVRSLVLRTGDFFGPHAANNWFSQALVRPNAPLRRITDPGTPGVGHAWAYLPDVAEAMLRLVERDDLAPFERFHFAGTWDADGTQMVAAIRRAAGDPRLKRHRFPWRLLGLARPFLPLARELAEMRYLWRMPVRLDNTRLLAVLGEEPRTSLDVAVRDTLVGLGCLPCPA